MIVVTLFSLFCFIAPSFIWALFLVVSRFRSSTANGTIIDHVSGSSDGDVSAPVIEFQVPDGRKFTFTGTYRNQTILDMLYEVFLKYVLKRNETQVKVLYDPNNPQKARVNSFGNIYFMPIILFIIGMCIILSSIPMFKPLFDFIDQIGK
jgi:hypothetical protein